MDFLKPVLGDDFEAFKERLDAYNLENPENTVVIADISGGDYIPVAEAEENIRRIKTENAVDLRLARCGARNPALVSKLLDFSSISLDGHTLRGFDEQLEEIKRENPFLFSQKSSTGMRQGSPTPSPYGGFMRAVKENQARR